MADARIAEYLAKAEECRAEAGRASRDDEKAAWLRMAEEWLKLSRGVQRDDDQTTHLNTRIDGETRPVHSTIVSR
jgi:hypothetical protein